MLLFLDFDGVLHPYTCGDKDVFCRAELLWRILRACPNVEVVFSTSWREIFSFEEMVIFVSRGGGEDLVSRFIGKTPVLKDGGDLPRRDIEIQNWIDTNEYSCHWLAIDDMPRMFNGHPNLYVVAGHRGLTDADVVALIDEFK
jgi:hypothetical protein